MRTLIEAEGIGKQYWTGERARYRTLRDTLVSFVKPRETRAVSREPFWALRDVSFTVREGDIVGIVGRNGAGKSTLLKVLSRITTPTTGRAEIHGRVGSLLEVGTGFHPELTGRDNIFLNGAILGMSRAEIRRKFDQIVDFAGVEQFIDTPVKRYSSGMYVRLAFSVAAHMEQEILVIDEVLAVGDAEFQKKCLGKMHDLSSAGRTILFVSHNSAAVANLCNRGILLNRGMITMDSSAGAVLAAYANELNKLTYSTDELRQHPSIRYIDLNQESLQRGELLLRVGFSSPFPLNPPIVGVIFYTLLGTPLFGTNARMHPKQYNGSPTASGEMTLQIDRLPLHSGSYKISVWLGDRAQDYDSKIDALSFDYVSPNFMPGMPSPEVIGVMDIPGRWSVRAQG